MMQSLDESFLNQIYEISVQQFASDSWSVSEFKQCFKNSCYKFYGIVENNVLVSYAVCFVCVDDINIVSVATRQAYKNKGFATTIINALKQTAKLYNITLSLEVKCNNLAAISLYNKTNFKPVHVRKNYYKDGSDAVIMFYNKNN